MDAVTVPAPRGGEVPSLVPLRPVPMYCGDDETSTVRPVAPLDSAARHRAEAERLMLLVAEARGSEAGCLVGMRAEQLREEEARAAVRKAGLSPARHVADAAARGAKAAAEAWERGAHICDDEARSLAQDALVEWALSRSGAPWDELRARVDAGDHDARREALDEAFDEFDVWPGGERRLEDYVAARLSAG